MLLKATSIPETQRDLWMKIMSKEFMSSEESGEEMLESGQKQSVLLVKSLKWRAPKVDRFFKQIDKKATKIKASNLSNNLYLELVVGSESTRSQPLGFSNDFYGFIAA